LLLGAEARASQTHANVALSAGTLFVFVLKVALVRVVIFGSVWANGLLINHGPQLICGSSNPCHACAGSARISFNWSGIPQAHQRYGTSQTPSQYFFWFSATPLLCTFHLNGKPPFCTMVQLSFLDSLPCKLSIKRCVWPDAWNFWNLSHG
jgi:hypothetical protein